MPQPARRIVKDDGKALMLRWEQAGTGRRFCHGYSRVAACRAHRRLAAALFCCHFVRCRPAVCFWHGFGKIFSAFCYMQRRQKEYEH